MSRKPRRDDPIANLRKVFAREMVRVLDVERSECIQIALRELERAAMFAEKPFADGYSLAVQQIAGLLRKRLGKAAQVTR